MKDFIKYAAACALVLSLGLIGAPQAFAKAHDQGPHGAPGSIILGPAATVNDAAWTLGE